ncbi:hypothetical protein [Streptomyces sp. V2]|uniref:hypothetical protein n=1 Tax=Streptomyces sp. V2 TaxID=1424099 RepID=UPI001403A80E|nr:hypothetical protein [Streptomyces sp. V2]
MGTSLTPEFWERFAILLAMAIGVTVVLSTALDTLVVRLRHRPPQRPRLPRTPAHR